MQFRGDPRRRTVALLASGVLLIFVVLGALQAFNTSGVSFLNPETAGETLIFAGLTVLVFLLLLLLLVLLLRNILKVYAGQGSSGLGARLRSRMMLGAVLIALAPAVFMFLFSFGLMNRSLDRWFSPNISELRDDSTLVVLELAQYVTTNARVEAESIAASGAPDHALPVLQNELAAHRITLAGGFAVVYGKDERLLADFQALPESSPASLIPWPEETGQGQAISLHGPLTVSLLSSAQRTDKPLIRVAGQDYALGIAATASGKFVVVALPMPQGLSQPAMRIRSGSAAYWKLFRSRNQIRTMFFLILLLITVLVVLLQRVAGAVSLQADHPAGRGAGRSQWTRSPPGKYDHRVALVATGEMAELVRVVQSHGGRSARPAANWLRLLPRN